MKCSVSRFMSHLTGNLNRQPPTTYYHSVSTTTRSPSDNPDDNHTSYHVVFVLYSCTHDREIQAWSPPPMHDYIEKPRQNCTLPILTRASPQHPGRHLVSTPDRGIPARDALGAHPGTGPAHHDCLTALADPTQHSLDFVSFQASQRHQLLLDDLPAYPIPTPTPLDTLFPDQEVQHIFRLMDAGWNLDQIRQLSNDHDMSMTLHMQIFINYQYMQILSKQ